MALVTVTAGIDIRAPRAEVWDVVGNLEKRMRLCPLWDVVSVRQVSPGPVGVGTVFEAHTRRNDRDIRHTSHLVAYAPGQRIANALEVEGETRTSWMLQDCAMGTRVMYQDSFLIPEGADERETTEAVRTAAREWLESVKRYLEWRENRTQKLVRWAYDRFLMRLPHSQRNLVVSIVVLHVLSAVSFAAAALALGLAWRP